MKVSAANGLQRALWVASGLWAIVVVAGHWDAFPTETLIVRDLTFRVATIGEDIGVNGFGRHLVLAGEASVEKAASSARDD
jgi:hypothetical protein